MKIPIRVVIVAILLAGLGLVPPPLATPAAAACADLITFEQAARRPGVAMLTGRGVRTIEDTGVVVFDVDRWFTGPHPARLLELDGSLVGLVEPPAAGTIPATTARTASGEAISLVRGEMVFMVVYGPDAERRYSPGICGIGAVPVASAEGREYVRKATAMFGQGLDVAHLPATDAVVPTPWTPPRGRLPWLPLAVFAGALAVALGVFGRRRMRPAGSA